MKVNPGKSHILLSSKKTEKVTIKDTVLKSSIEKKLLGITPDIESIFEKHITGICNKVSQNRCPLIWLFHLRRLDDKINNVHEKALAVVYSDYKSTFQEFID